MNAAPQPVLIRPEIYRRVHDCLQCDECGATTALPRLGLRHKLGCNAIGGVRALSPREQQIAILTARGKSSREISDALGMAWRTVNTHKYNMYRRLGVSKSVQLVGLLYESGILKPEGRQ